MVIGYLSLVTCHLLLATVALAGANGDDRAAARARRLAICRIKVILQNSLTSSSPLRVNNARSVSALMSRGKNRVCPSANRT